jgi:hypothetical protein
MTSTGFQEVRKHYNIDIVSRVVENVPEDLKNVQKNQNYPIFEWTMFSY